MSSDKKKLVAANAGVLALAAIASFVLPRIAASVTDGRAYRDGTGSTDSLCDSDFMRLHW